MSLHTKINGLKEVWKFDNRWSLMLTKTLFPGEKLHIYRYKGIELLNDHAAGDANGARDVLLSPMYRRFFSQMKFDGAINVLDLGANNGGFPLLLKAEGLKLKKVVSVELNPKTFSRLRFNLERNLNGKIIALNAALCGEGGWLEVSLGAGSTADNIYEIGEGSRGEKYRIKGLTFDEIYAEYFENETIDICKIDVEGAEFEVLSEPAHQNLANCRYLIMEIHEGENRSAAAILPALDKLGFVLSSEPTADSVYFFRNSKLT